MYKRKYSSHRTLDRNNFLVKYQEDIEQSLARNREALDKYPINSADSTKCKKTSYEIRLSFALDHNNIDEQRWILKTLEQQLEKEKNTVVFYKSEFEKIKNEILFNMKSIINEQNLKKINGFIKNITESWQFIEDNNFSIKKSKIYDDWRERFGEVEYFFAYSMSDDEKKVYNLIKKYKEIGVDYIAAYFDEIYIGKSIEELRIFNDNMKSRVD